MSFGMIELALVLLIVLIIFGAGRLPQLGEGLGKAIKGFKKSAHQAETIEGQADLTSPPGPPSPPSEDLPAPAAPSRPNTRSAQTDPPSKTTTDQS